MDIVTYNREAWTNEVKTNNIWTIPITTEEVERAKQGIFTLLLTPTKPVPKEWLGEVSGRKVLCFKAGRSPSGRLL